MSTPSRVLYEQMLENNQRRQRESQLRSHNEQVYDPNLAGRIFAAGARSGLPSEVVAADLPNIEEALRREEFDLSQYTDAMNGSPVFNRFAAENPYHFMVLDRDREKLTRFERATESIFMGWDAGWAMTEIAEIRGRQMQTGEVQPGDEERLNELRKWQSWDMYGDGNIAAKILIGTANQIPIQWWLLEESVDEAAAGATAGMVSALVYGQAGPQIATPEEVITGPAMATAGATVGFTTGRFDASMRLEGALAYDEYLEMGFSEEDARNVASYVGVIGGSLEAIGLGAILKRVPGFRRLQNDATGQIIDKVFNQPTMRHAIGRATAEYGEALGTELVTEILQEATLMAGREYLKGQAREAGDLRPEYAPATMDEILTQIRDITVHTLYGSAILSGIGPGASFYRDSKNSWRASRLLQAWETVHETSRDVQSRTDGSGIYDAFVDRLSDGGEAKEVLVTSQEFREYFQSQGIDPSDVANELGIKNYDESVELGTDVAIPMRTYLQKVAHTEHHNGLVRHIRTKPDQMTAAMAEQFDKGRDAQIAELQELLRTGDPTDADVNQEIYQDLYGQLIAQGMTASVAEHKALLNAAVFTNMAKQEGLDPVQLYNERFAGVEGEQPTALSKAAESVDAQLDPLLDTIRAGQIPTQREIFGDSLVDFIRNRGGLVDDGGEITARDLQKQFRGLLKDTGDTLDGMAEAAFEAGFISERSPDVLLEALDRESRGEPVFAMGGQDDVMAEYARTLEELGSYLEQEGVDIEAMTNAEIRELLSLGREFAQDWEIDTSDLEDLTELVFTSAQWDPAILARAEALMPEIFGDQDFGEARFEEEVTVQETGAAVMLERKFQQEWDRLNKQRSMLQRLLECVRG